ncbi:MAG TPA: hydrogenase 2 operon protein HybA [Longimicrobiales bacterium]|nr:hydrogenase 2 operon protein HybA [Longimicrobiales bacterium]
MSSLDRRSLLKGMAAAGASAVAGTAALATGASAAGPAVDAGSTLGLLFDATRCIGCKACMVACREANDVAYADANALHDDSADLSANTLNVIKLYSNGDDEFAFMKMQCMHCIDPACAAACMFGALQKREGGIVSWNGDACTGCRYCQIACPFNVPRFEWASRNPRVMKCELCRHRVVEGGVPACAEVCPRDAVVYGRRDDLLAEARQRMRANPGAYYPKIYGEYDGGGTQVLYIAPVEPEKLGLPKLGEAGVPELVRGVQGAIYKGFAAPVALYAIMGVAIARNHRKEQAQVQKEDV